MNTLTVRGLDTVLTDRLKDQAKKEGKSVNKLIVETLNKHFNINDEAKHNVRHHDMDHLFGKWSDENYKNIQDKIDSERTIDGELWK